MHRVTSRMWIFGLLILSSFHDGLVIFHGLWIRWYRGIMWSESPQLCPTLCDPMDFTVHEIFQARILEWVAYLFSRRSSWPRNLTGVSCIAGGFFTNWAIKEVMIRVHNLVVYHLDSDSKLKISVVKLGKSLDFWASCPICEPWIKIFLFVTVAEDN